MRFSFEYFCMRSTRILLHQNPLGIPRKDKFIPVKERLSQGLPLQRRLLPRGHTLIVSSAKGGVGKSTTSVNLACALAASGKRVGLLDADVFGPSIPRMMRLDGPSASFIPALTEKNKIVPLVEYGVSCMSIGFLVDQTAPVVWRGMMVMKAIQQLLWDVEWGDLDFLVIDAPPGTGDVHLSIAQQVLLDGAIVVSTPQDVALLDTVKGIEMFKKVNVPILGMVQNMSYHICPNCNTKSHIFGQDGVHRKAKEMGIQVLADVPLHVDVCTTSDSGRPITLSQPTSMHAQVYRTLASTVTDILKRKSHNVKSDV